MKIKKSTIITTLFPLIFMILPCAADDGAAEVFYAFLDGLEEEGLIEEGGEIIHFEDYSNELAQMRYYRWSPFTEAERFVMSAVISMDSAIERPNYYDAGCGIVFNSLDKENHLLISTRMDGYIYTTGYKYNTEFSYEKHKYGNVSPQKTFEFVMIADKSSVTVYIDGQRIFRNSGITSFGPKVGFAVLSGANADFGTRCTFNDVYTYVW